MRVSCRRLQRLLRVKMRRIGRRTLRIIYWFGPENPKAVKNSIAGICYSATMHRENSTNIT